MLISNIIFQWNFKIGGLFYKYEPMNVMFSNINVQYKLFNQNFHGEFDPGSG